MWWKFCTVCINLLSESSNRLTKHMVKPSGHGTLSNCTSPNCSKYFYLCESPLHPFLFYLIDLRKFRVIKRRSPAFMFLCKLCLESTMAFLISTVSTISSPLTTNLSLVMPSMGYCHPLKNLVFHLPA